MNRIQRIQNYLEHYKSLDPYPKDLTKESHLYYQLELMNEYLRVSRHPYPTEYLHP